MRKWTVAMAAMSLVAVVSGCAGVRQSKGTFVAHAESFRFFGVVLPEDDQQAALDQVPAGGKITNVSSTSADWTSFLGILGNVMGIHTTQIGGTTR